MKPQALAHNTTIYYHTRWRCVSCDKVQGCHKGGESGVRMEEGFRVNWDQVFISEEEAKADLQRMSRYKEKDA